MTLQQLAKHWKMPNRNYDCIVCWSTFHGILCRSMCYSRNSACCLQMSRVLLNVVLGNFLELCRFLLLVSSVWSFRFVGCLKRNTFAIAFAPSCVFSWRNSYAVYVAAGQTPLFMHHWSTCRLCLHLLQVCRWVSGGLLLVFLVLKVYLLICLYWPI